MRRTVWLLIFSVFAACSAEPDLPDWGPSGLSLTLPNPVTSSVGQPIRGMIIATAPLGHPVKLNAAGLPMGSSWIDRGDGTALFTWTPVTGQAGQYTIEVQAVSGSQRRAAPWLIDVLASPTGGQIELVELIGSTAAQPLQAKVTTKPEGLPVLLRWFVNDVELGSESTFQGHRRGDRIFVRASLWRDGPTVDSEVRVIANTPPSVAAVTVSTPVSRTGVRAYPSGWRDADGDTPGYRCMWYVNGLRQLGDACQWEPENLLPGDGVWVEVRPFDGFDEGPVVVSSVATAESAPPAIGTVSLTSLNSGYAAAVTGVSDPDGDQVTILLYWFVNDVPREGYAETFLPRASLRRGDRVHVEVVGWDGYTLSQPVRSVELTVPNAAPSLAAAELWPNAPRRGETVQLQISGALDPDGDAVSYIVDWYANGTFAFSTNSVTFATSTYSKGTTITAQVRLYDGMASSEPRWSNAVTIANSPPQLSQVTLTPTDVTYGTSQMLALVNSVTDADGDTVTLQYRWVRGGNEIVTGANQLTFNPPPEQGERIVVWVTASDGVDSSSATVTHTVDLRLVKSLAAGGAHTCARMHWNALYCWGDNLVGQLGVGNTGGYALTPQIVSNFSNDVSSVTVGGQHTCAITLTGDLKCWGNNAVGQLGMGTAGGNQSTPVDISIGGGVSVRAVAAGQDFTCAIVQDRSVYCWGRNASGQLGLGNQIDYNLPQRLTSISDVLSIVAGGSHTCAIEMDGSVWCWGANGSGQLGLGSIGGSSALPQKLQNLSGVRQLSLGVAHTCAVTQDNELYCWGSNDNGQLGLSGSGIPSPTLVASSVGQVMAGANHTCYVGLLGDVRCTGNNGYGQLGNGSSGGTQSSFAAAVWDPGTGQNWPLEKMSDLGAGANHTCALTRGGAVRCWGANEFGQLGVGNTTSHTTATLVMGMPLVGASGVSVGGKSSCAIAQDGGLKCWGANLDGQLGLGTYSGVEPLPKDVIGLPGPVRSVSLGRWHTCAVAWYGASRVVYCWGYDKDGRVGNGVADGDNDSYSVPVSVSTPGGRVPAAVSLGAHHSCALYDFVGPGMANAYCWGFNGDGQLGTCDNTNRSNPAPLRTDSDCTYPPAYVDGAWGLSAGGGFTCVWRNNMEVLCSGRNTSGQLGDGSMNNGVNYAKVSFLTNSVLGVRWVSAGLAHACQLKFDTSGVGYPSCWGYGADGQLGNANIDSWATPQTVVKKNGQPLSGMVGIASGNSRTCALDKSGTAWCWGAPALGDGTVGFTSTAISLSGYRFRNISVSSAEYLGAGHICGVTADDGILCWGNNDAGQLGDGTLTSALSPVEVKNSAYWWRRP